MELGMDLGLFSFLQDFIYSFKFLQSCLKLFKKNLIYISVGQSKFDHRLVSTQTMKFSDFFLNVLALFFRL